MEKLIEFLMLLSCIVLSFILHSSAVNGTYSKFGGLAPPFFF